MLAHLRTKLGTIAVAVLIMTVLPLALERWRSLRDERMYNATVHELQYGDVRQFFAIRAGMTATDVKENDPEGISTTTFERHAWRDISSHQVLKLSCRYNGNRIIDLRERAPIRVPIEEGERTITIAYSLHEFGLDEFVQKGFDPKKCAFVWTKEWTLHPAPGVDRIYQLQSNAFRIVAE